MEPVDGNDNSRSPGPSPYIFGFYSFLENVISAIEPPETPDDETVPLANATDVKPGGYDESMFMFLSDSEKVEYQCSICLMIMRDVHQCRNLHQFCYGCVFVWSSKPGGNADKCPMCRVDGLYARNATLTDRIGRKRVKCLIANRREDDDIKVDCNWRGFLRDYDDHEHRQYATSELSTGIQLPQISQANSSTKNNNSAGLGLTTGGSTQPERLGNSTAAEGNPTVTNANSPLPMAAGYAPRQAALHAIPRPPAVPRPANAAVGSTSAARSVRGVQSRTSTTARRSTDDHTTDSTPTTTAPAATPSRATSINIVHDETNDVSPAPVSLPGPSAAPVTTSSTTVSGGAMEYRRLAEPTRARQTLENLRSGQEQISLLMTLLSVELETQRMHVERMQREARGRETRRQEQLVQVQLLSHRLNRVNNAIDEVVRTPIRRRFLTRQPSASGEQPPSAATTTSTSTSSSATPTTTASANSEPPPSNENGGADPGPLS